MLELLKSTLTQIIASYSQYVGVGSCMLIFFVSLLYIYIIESRKDTRSLLCYYPLITLLVVFNPLIAYIIIKLIEEQVYWRMFWILPITCVVAYAATAMVVRVSEKPKKIVAIIALTAIIIMGGKFIFTSDNYSKPSNWYKLPAQTIEVCNIIENDSKGDIRVVVPEELGVSLRQYDANIQMVYGRDGYVNSYDSTYYDRNALYTLMQQSGLDMDLISYYMKKFQCNYLVFCKTVLLIGNLESYGYQYVASTDSYDIYRFNYNG